MATHYLDHHLALLAHLRGILVALGEAEQVEDDSHALFLERFDELVAQLPSDPESSQYLGQDIISQVFHRYPQIAHLVPGSKVHLHVDAYENDDILGTVESIAPASGSVFSLLPAENATGNFTKVTQRVPVRIALPKEALEGGRLRAGLSVVVDVDSRTAPAE